MTQAPQTETWRARVLALHRDGLTPAEIAAAINRDEATATRSTGWVNTIIHRLRMAGELPPAPLVDPVSLPGRALALVQAAGAAGRRFVALQHDLVCGAEELRRALRRLTAIEAIRQEPDGLVIAASLARMPASQGERRAATASLADVANYGLTLAQDGSPERAAAFLRRAYDRLALGHSVIPIEAVNLLVLADLIAAPETQAPGGSLRSYGTMVPLARLG